MANAGDLEQPLLDEHGNEVKPKVSRNVYVTYALLFMWGLADSIWSGAILSAWLFLLAGGQPNPNQNSNTFYFVPEIIRNSIVFDEKLLGGELLTPNASDAQSANANTIVGGVEALQGIASLVTALPIGYLADKYGRSPMCKIGGVGFIIAAALTLISINHSLDEHTEIILLGLSLCMWGTFGGIFSGPSQALFADSVPKGQRSYYYTLLQVAYMAPSIVGPCLAIFLFQKYGDRWDYDELRLPFRVGICLEFPAAILAFFLRDDLALDEPDEKADNKKTEEDDNTGSERDNSWSRKRESYQVPFIGITLNRASIPYVLFISDLFYSLGSGMTIKFFPLFFMKEIKLSPSEVQLIRILATVLLMSFSFVAQSLSKKIGRVQVVSLCRCSGIGLMIVLALLVHHGFKSWYIIIPIYLIRTGLMNCAYPLDESILMDNVKKNERSRWKALESVSVFGWCGSALLGGILADKYSYDFSFLITAIMQGSGAVIYFLLIPLVLDEIDPDVNKAEATNSILLSGSQEVGSPRMNVSAVEEELIRPLQQSP